ncbi:MAG: carboxylating nicotinate-nucleotide diphosphorylase [Saprospiraceae bacterium]|uniref:Probable nicotinate-nucleotide pyrophosphorylase [carboxylating] n=1 Tax=Candidatus Opimibacter skivensis TaxID=2982028 RepID=A0A9D7XSH8_9BACT|nr:carboxylating nicotinate-nucleotide diphosphorylase [Candidatus Opimibacter skivensis]
MHDYETLLDDFIHRGLAEDVGEGDHTSMACIRSTRISKAKLLIKDDGIISGVNVAKRIFHSLAAAADFEELIPDGSVVKPGDIAFYITCPTRALLMGERLALNTMQRMSGISTIASLFAQEVEGLPVKVLDTRKTTPGMRFLEKEAVRLGGCNNYRSGLYDWIMIKDNHIDACGNIPTAIDRVQEYLGKTKREMGITIEVRNLVELQQVLDHGGVTRIMLDNFEIPILKEAIAMVGNQFETEASGSITLHNVRAYAETGVDFVSSGALTHSAGTLDMSLKIIFSEG